MKRLGRIDAKRGTGVPVNDLREDARTLLRDEFEDRHGGAFLLLSAADLGMSLDPMHTEVRLETSDAPPRAEATVNLSWIVFPVRHNGGSASHLITIGRAPDCDVVIPDVSISRFHAFAKRGPRGEWLLHDAGSTNGTTLNTHTVPRQGHGHASEMKAGDDVRLGQVDLTFLDVEAFVSFALRIGG